MTVNQTTNQTDTTDSKPGSLSNAWCILCNVVAALYAVGVFFVQCVYGCGKFFFWDHLLYTCALVTVFVVACAILRVLKHLVVKDSWFRYAVTCLAGAIFLLLKFQTSAWNVCQLLWGGFSNSSPFFWHCFDTVGSILGLAASLGGIIFSLVYCFIRFVRVCIHRINDSTIEFPNEPGSLIIHPSVRPYLGWLVDPSACSDDPNVQTDLPPAETPAETPADTPVETNPASAAGVEVAEVFRFRGVRPTTAVPTPVFNARARTANQPAPVFNKPAPAATEVGPADVTEEATHTFTITNHRTNKKVEITVPMSGFTRFMDNLPEEYGPRPSKFSKQ